MEINFTRHGVKADQTLFCDLAEIQIEGNMNLPRNREPKRILKCSGRVAVTSKSVSDKTVTVEGTATVSIIYLDSGNCLCNHEHILLYSKTLESDRDLSGGEVYTQISDEKFSAAISADCMVTVSGSFSLNVCVKTTVEQEIICDIDNRDIEQLRGKAEATMPMGRGEKNLIVEEEISIGNGQPSVECIIRHNATVTVDEVRIISGKVMVKGTAKIYVLYLPEEGTRPQSFEDSFPFSQLVDVDGINDSCKCDCEVKILFCELSPRVGNDDEIRAFSISAKLAVSVKAYCDDEIPTVIDAYSTQGNCKMSRGTFTFKKIKERICEKFIAKKNLEFTDGAIGSVIDMWCENKKSVCKFEDGKLKLNGTMLVNILAYDCEGVPNCYERPVDFEYIYKPEAALNRPEAVCDITVAHSSYTITGANTVSVAVEPQISATIYDNMEYQLLTDIAEDENATDTKDRRSSIVLYFADAGESVWDIARRYNSSVSEIKALNSVTEDMLTEAKKFIIPTK